MAKIIGAMFIALSAFLFAAFFYLNKDGNLVTANVVGSPVSLTLFDILGGSALSFAIVSMTMGMLFLFRIGRN